MDEVSYVVRFGLRGPRNGRRHPTARYFATEAEAREEADRLLDGTSETIRIYGGRITFLTIERREVLYDVQLNQGAAPLVGPQQ